MVRLPTYKLYGDSGASDAIDWLHCETISERARLHNWNIRPHRHQALTQLMIVERGSADLQLDGQVLALRAPALVWVPAPAVHGFRFTPETQGLVATIHEAHLATLLAAEPTLLRTLSLPWAAVLRRADPAFRVLAAAAQELTTEFRAAGPWRTLALDGLTLRLAVAAARLIAAAPGGAAGASARARSHVTRYKALVEAAFRRQPQLGELAGELGISVAQLNRLCRRELGHTALGLLQDRIALEAKRELSYTTLSVKQVAHQLGFADPAYFTRFFQRETGLTPTQWRAQGPARPPDVRGSPVAKTAAPAQARRASPQKL